MATEFDYLVASLWRSLGLLAPAPGATAHLTVDGRTVSLAPTATGRGVLVSIDLGRLSEDPLVEAEQVRRLLRSAAGFALGNPAALRLRPGGSDKEPMASVEALAPCRAGEADALRRAIEDALALADAHRPIVSAASGPLSAQARPAGLSDDHLIFRL